MVKRKNNNYIFDLIIRYFLAFAASYNGLFTFYYIFTPLTIYPVLFILNLFISPILNGNTIILREFTIELIPACIAGSAYYLLFILNMVVPNVDIVKRVKMILFSFASLLILNILRILSMIALASYNLSFFNLAHKFFWYFLNIILVVIIWFVEIAIFKIKSIPFLDDISNLYKLTKE